MAIKGSCLRLPSEREGELLRSGLLRRVSLKVNQRLHFFPTTSIIPSFRWPEGDFRLRVEGDATHVAGPIDGEDEEEDGSGTQNPCHPFQCSFHCSP